MAQISVKRVLYVEDDPGIQVVAKLALETVGGLEVKVCSSGQEALDVCVAFAPDCVLLDVMMPGMDGPEVFAALRELPGCKTMPVIFMTAKVQTAEVDYLRSLGAIGVIPKPFNPMQLAATVRKIVATST